MVCLGNICRSPLAEGILRHKIEIYGVDAVVDSAGTAAYHAGERPDGRSQDIARKHGIDISGQRARRFTVNDFDHFDKIFAMDRSNYENIVSLARNHEDISKVELILNRLAPGSDGQVPDPYYGGRDGFLNVYNMLDEACQKIIEELTEKQTRR